MATPLSFDLAQIVPGEGEVARRLRALDWDASPLGRPEGWPVALRASIGICVTSRLPMLLWWGRELTLIYNEACLPLLGPEHHPAALGRPGGEAWPQLWGTIGPLVEHVLETGQPSSAQELLLSLGGHGTQEEIYVTLSFSPIHGDGPEPAGVFCACTEATAQVLAHRRLQTLRRLAAEAAVTRGVAEACRAAGEVLRSAEDDLPHFAIYLVAEDGAAAVLAASSELAEAGPSLPPRVSRDSTTDELARVLREREPVELGAPRPALILPVRAGSQGALAAILSAGLDRRRPLDEDYRAFLELAAAQIGTALANARAFGEEQKRLESQAALERSKREFFTTVSHEFRTPLTLMLGPLEQLVQEFAENAPTAPERTGQRELAEVAYRNALLLLRLVNTLLDFSRAEEGRLRPAYEPVDLASFTEELASTFRAAIAAARLRFEVHCAPLPEPVFVDRGMWEKIVLNLLGNAVRHTAEGSITLSLRWRGRSVELEVADTGRGLSPAEMPRLFERFPRPPGQASPPDGTGMDLAMVEQLIQLHGGQVRVESAPGAGTRFRVTIPSGRAHIPTEQLLSFHAGAEPGEPGPEQREGGSAELEPASLPVPRPRVLFADENSDMRRYVGRLLAPYYTVETVSHGEAAFQRILARPPDLILTDAQVPHRDGQSLLRQLRADPRTRNLPVIVLASPAAEDWRKEGAQQRADDYVVKPFTARELLARLATLLELTRLRRSGEEQSRVATAEAGRRADERTGDMERLLATLRRREEVLAQANSALQARVTELEAANLGVRDSRRAALNLLEDAVESRHLLQDEMAERRHAEEALAASEEQFRRAIEEAPVPIVMLAEDGQVLQVSKSWAEQTGYSREEMPTLEAWLDRAYPDGLSEGRTRVEEVFRGRRSSEPAELEVVTRSEEKRTWMVSASPVGALRDGRRFVVAMAVDVTDRRRAERALAASQEQLRLIVESASEYAILSFDLARRITSWNRGAEQILGFRREEVLGRPADIIFVPEDRATGAPEREAQQALTQGRAADERWHLRKNGSRFWGSGVMLPMHVGPEPEVIGFVKIFRDETEKLRASEALEKSRAELWQALQETERARAEAEAAGLAKDHFLAVLSHELRTPLTPVLMATHTLARRKDLPPTVREALTMIRRNIEMESGFVDDLLDVTRLARGKLELVRKPMDVHEAVSHAIEICHADLEGRKQRLIVDLGANETRIEGDFARVQQVVWNVLKNASKFTPEGGEIRLRSRNEGGAVVVEITDSGIGIAPEALGRIFDPFIQADQSITRQFGGLGLGLAIARATVQAHGGELRAASEGAGRGATFSFSLPLPPGNNRGADGGLA